MDNSVMFKGNKNGLVIILDKNKSFEELKEVFIKKASESKNFFGSADTSVVFSGKIISKHEKDELLNILSTETSLQIREPANKPLGPKADTENKKETEQKIKININTTQTDAIFEQQTKPHPEAEIHYENSFFHKGNLRSGQAINYKGSVVVVGDVNPGGEIIAEGNVIIIGSVKGMVHAGCAGDRSSFVFALKFAPIQLRIADSIAYIPKEFSKKAKSGATMAYIENGQIFIAPM